MDTSRTALSTCQLLLLSFLQLRWLLNRNFCYAGTHIQLADARCFQWLPVTYPKQQGFEVVYKESYTKLPGCTSAYQLRTWYFCFIIWKIVLIILEPIICKCSKDKKETTGIDPSEVWYHHRGVNSGLGVFKSFLLLNKKKIWDEFLSKEGVYVRSQFWRLMVQYNVMPLVQHLIRMREPRTDAEGGSLGLTSVNQSALPQDMHFTSKSLMTPSPPPWPPPRYHDWSKPPSPQTINHWYESIDTRR